ncbi:unnamed protein product [Prunus armeniaca]
MIGIRHIEGALDVTPLPKRPMGPNEVAVILIPGDEAKKGAEQAKENEAKIAELKAKLEASEKAVREAEDAKAAMKMALDVTERAKAAEVEEAKAKVIADYRSSEEFTVLVEKEFMDQCDKLVYHFKQFNVDKKLNLNFLWDYPPLP